MKALFLFLGLGLGFAFFLEALEIKTLLGLLSLFLLFLSFRKKAPLFFIVSFCFGLGMAALWNLPTQEGQREIVGTVYKRTDSYILLYHPGVRLCVSAIDNTYQVGDILKVSGNVQTLVRTHYESRFDFGRYLERFGVCEEIRYAKIENVFLWPIRSIELQNKFLAHFDNSTSSILSSILFNRKNFEEEATEILQSLNLLFLYSASGMLLSRFLSLIRFFCDKIFKKKKTVDGIVFGTSLLFIPLALSKFGMGKVILLLGLRFYFEHIQKKKMPSLTVLSIAGILQILIFPYCVFQDGFLLSYGISLAFAFFGGNLSRIESKRKRKIASFAFLQAIVIPMGIQFNGSFHLLSPLFSLLLTPFAVLLFSLGFVSYASFPFVSSLNALGNGTMTLIRAFSKIDLALPLPKWSPWVLAIYYGCFVGWMLFKEVDFPRVRKQLSFGFIGIYCLSLLPLGSAFSQGVYFIDVGQGDAILIRDHFTSVLIDTGGNLGFDMASESLIPFFRKIGIDHIDAFIASHQDYDHVGAKESLIEHFTVKECYEKASDFPLDVGSLHFENFNVFEADEENDASLVLKLDFMGKKWLFTGDAPIAVEKKILSSGFDVDCDILKVGHHGSKTSSSMAFLMAASPEEAVISVGSRNVYRHPDREVLDRLEGLNIKIRRTDVEGTIRYAKFSPPWV